MKFGEHRFSLWPGEGSKFQFDMGIPPIEIRSGNELVVWFGPPTVPSAPVVFRSCRQIELFAEPPSDLAWDDPFFSVIDMARAQQEESGSMRSSHGRVASAAQLDVYCPIETISPDQRLYLWEARDASNPTLAARALSSCDLSDPKQRKEVSLAYVLCCISGFMVLFGSCWNFLIKLLRMELICIGFRPFSCCCTCIRPRLCVTWRFVICLRGTMSWAMWRSRESLCCRSRLTTPILLPPPISESCARKQLPCCCCFFLGQCLADLGALLCRTTVLGFTGACSRLRKSHRAQAFASLRICDCSCCYSTSPSRSPSQSLLK